MLHFILKIYFGGKTILTSSEGPELHLAVLKLVLVWRWLLLSFVHDV